MSDDLFGDVRDDSLLDHLSDETENVRFPSILAELNSILSRELARLGGDSSHSLELVIAITRHIGGMQIYVPRGQRLEFWYAICKSGVITVTGPALIPL